MSGITRSNLRSFLRRRARDRKASTFTADDAHAFFERMGVNLSTGERLSYINSICNTNNDEVIQVGTRPSTRPEAKGRAISEWIFA